ncbi:MAG: MOSC domain-containing protein [Candidatus Taylorbacteria bacterium]|nr:MOSC domain-containing protein [Candidatus Taylorbacteria bacterium]
MKFNTSLGTFSIAPLFGARSVSYRGGVLFTESGLLYDKQFALMTPNGTILDKNTCPPLSELLVEIDWGENRVHGVGDDRLVFSSELAGEGCAFKLNRRDDSACTFSATYGSVAFSGVDLGDEPAEWFSNVVGTTCRVVKLARRKPAMFHDGVHGDFATNFGGVTPIQLVAINTITHLHTIVREAGLGCLAGSDFGTNICLTDLKAFQEKTFLGKELLIGGRVKLKVIDQTHVTQSFGYDMDLTHRCQRDGREVLKVLEQFHVRGRLLVGVSCVVKQPGFVNQGDDITVL